MSAHAGRFLAGLLAAGTLSAASGQGFAQFDYPTKPVHLIIVYAAGGGLDIIGRVVAERLSQRLGQSVVVENRPGAGGNIGTASVAKAAADGYTLLETTNSFNINSFIYKNTGFDRKDFAAVIELTQAPSVLVTGPKSPFRSVQELLTAVRAQPGKFTYSHAGRGSATHIAGEMFRTAAGIDLTNVPYTSASQANTEVMGGQVPLAMSALVAVTQFIQAGRLQALAITSDKRWPTVPQVATFVESGYPKVVHLTWIGILAPAGTPSSIIARLNREIAAVLSIPEVRERIIQLGAEPVGKSAAEFEAVIRAEFEATRQLASQIGLGPE